VSEPAPERKDPTEAGRPEVPVTGEPEVDRALQSLQGIESEPLADHHDRLARVHEDLHAALNADHSASDG
jgi:hypothetical protein